MPSLTFVMPHWLYWAGLLVFPLVAAYLVRHGAVPAAPRARISAEQGYAVGRPSLIVVDALARGDDLELRVGGRVARAAEGVIYY